ncbi:MAG: hypothetical protein KatS3mg014_2021 [Actinomycetota bacterium]|nr:MAG: hypothetical protein KatS3mg014_2021 [Actinomycetota bacterium]
MVNVYDLTLEQLTERLAAWGEPAFRARQLYRQLWRRSATYEEMTDLPAGLRERLAEELPIAVRVLDRAHRRPRRDAEGAPRARGAARDRDRDHGLPRPA